jgi:hypothetical protein
MSIFGAEDTRNCWVPVERTFVDATLLKDGRVVHRFILRTQNLTSAETSSNIAPWKKTTL